MQNSFVSHLPDKDKEKLFAIYMRSMWSPYAILL